MQYVCRILKYIYLRNYVFDKKIVNFRLEKWKKKFKVLLCAEQTKVGEKIIIIIIIF